MPNSSLPLPFPFWPSSALALSRLCLFQSAYSDGAFTTIAAVTSSVEAQVLRLTWLLLWIAFIGRRIAVMATMKIPSVNRQRSWNLRRQGAVRRATKGIGRMMSITSVTMLRIPSKSSCSWAFAHSPKRKKISRWLRLGERPWVLTWIWQDLPVQTHWPTFNDV